MRRRCARNTVFILGRRIAGIPHFLKKSPKLSDTVRDKSSTLNHVAVIFKIRLSFHTLGSKGLENKQNTYRKENFLVLYFSKHLRTSQIISLNCGPLTTSNLAAKTIDVGPKIMWKKQFFCLK